MNQLGLQPGSVLFLLCLDAAKADTRGDCSEPLSEPPEAKRLELT